MSDSTRTLAGLTEIGKAIGLTRQRVSQLAARDDFPEPVLNLPQRRAWDLEAVVAWNRARLDTGEASESEVTP